MQRDGSTSDGSLILAFAEDYVIQAVCDVEASGAKMGDSAYGDGF